MSEVIIELTDPQRLVVSKAGKRYRATTAELVKALALSGTDMILQHATSDECVLDAFQQFVDANGVPGDTDQN